MWLNLLSGQQTYNMAIVKVEKEYFSPQSSSWLFHIILFFYNPHKSVLDTGTLTARDLVILQVHLFISWDSFRWINLQNSIAPENWSPLHGYFFFNLG